MSWASWGASWANAWARAWGYVANTVRHYVRPHEYVRAYVREDAEANVREVNASVSLTPYLATATPRGHVVEAFARPPAECAVTNPLVGVTAL